MFNLGLPSQPHGTSHPYLLEETDIDQAKNLHVKVQHVEGFLPCRGGDIIIYIPYIFLKHNIVLPLHSFEVKFIWTLGW